MSNLIIKTIIYFILAAINISTVKADMNDPLQSRINSGIIAKLFPQAESLGAPTGSPPYIPVYGTDDNVTIDETLLAKLKSGEKLTLQEIPIDPQLTEKIFKFASIKHILNSHQDNQDKIFEMLEEVSKDLKNYDLEFRIEELESKFSKDLSESTFNEIRELKKEKNIN